MKGHVLGLSGTKIMAVSCTSPLASVSEQLLALLCGIPTALGPGFPTSVSPFLEYLL